jgi:hypothetical protein
VPLVAAHIADISARLVRAAKPSSKKVQPG